MAEMNENRPIRRYRARHRGRSEQVGIYLGKLLRMFVYQSDWKVLPMSALIAGLVGMVTRRRIFITMEGTLMGSFALVCVALWNGCFNSIQVICRERDVIKREHRSGMHISSYIFSHMLYQLMLCILQTGITLYVLRFIGVQFPADGMFTPWMIVDLGITMLLIAYAADMLSLWVSSLAKTTTTAMTVMIFVLIFQLVFSGGMLTLPAWTAPLTHFTISNPGLKAIAAQADTNNRPFVTISDMVGRMRNDEVTTTVTLGQVLDILTDRDNPTVAEIRKIEINGTMTMAEIKELLYTSETVAVHRNDPFTEGMTIGYALDLLEIMGFWEENADQTIELHSTVGEVADIMAANPDIQSRRDESYTLTTTVGGLLDIAGEKKVRTFLEDRAAAASYNADYALTEDNILFYWLHLMGFIALFAFLSTITLEFVDKDRR